MSVKISELPILDSLADNDVIAGVDTSANVTSKIEMATLKNYIDTNTQYTAGTNINITNNVVSAPNVYNKTETDGLIDDLETNINEQLEEKDEQIEELQSEVDSLSTIYNAFPTESGEGESLTLDDTAEVKFKKFDLKGNTSQTTYSGKNLFKVSKGTFTKNGVTATIKDSIITLNGTATANVYLVITSTEDRYSHTFSGNYTISKITSATTIGSALYGTDSGGTDRAFLTINNNTSTKTQAINDTYTSIRVQLNIDNGATFNNTIVKIQLESGSSATDFEPFVGGTASPNPEFPQPVNVVSGDNEIRVSRKNLLKYPYLNTTSTVSGVTFTDNGNGSITINGTSTSSTFSLWFLYENAWNYDSLSFELAPGTYTFKGLGASGVRMAINFYTSDNANQYFEVFNQDVTKTISEIVRVNARLIVNGGVTVNNVTVYPQIEVGSTSSSFEPYNGDEYPINLPVENLYNATRNEATSSAVTYKGDTSKIYINGTPSGDGRIFFNKVYLNAGTYTFSASLSSGSFVGTNNSTYLYLYRGTEQNVSWTYDTRIILTNTKGNVASSTFTISESNYYYLAWYLDANYTWTNAEINYQVERGTKFGGFTPYGTIPLELCKMPNTDYEDTFIHDKTLDKWYWHREIGKVVFNGSNKTFYITTTDTNTTRFYTDIPDITNGLEDTMTPKLITNYFTPVTFRTIYTNDESCIAQYGGTQDSLRKRIYLRINKSLATSVNELNTWLSTHNTSVYYVLDTPTNTEITYQPLIDQLNLLEKAMSKDGQTNISQVNNDLPFIISAEAILSLKNVLDRITLLES